jgi:hypothetical protein
MGSSFLVDRSKESGEPFLKSITPGLGLNAGVLFFDNSSFKLHTGLVLVVFDSYVKEKPYPLYPGEQQTYVRVNRQITAIETGIEVRFFDVVALQVNLGSISSDSHRNYNIPIWASVRAFYIVNKKLDIGLEQNAPCNLASLGASRRSRINRDRSLCSLYYFLV